MTFASFTTFVGRWQTARRRRRTLEVYCDGSAEGRAGRRGGWAFLVVRGDEVLHSGSGASRSTTNVVMELSAALEGLTFVVARGWAQDFGVELVSDSSIALEVAEGRYQPRAYPVVSGSLRAAAVAARATTRKVRAHSGHRWNDAVDALARTARLGEP